MFTRRSYLDLTVGVLTFISRDMARKDFLLAPTGDVLIAARALQGIGAAFIAPAAMSMVMSLFTIPTERNKALGL